VRWFAVALNESLDDFVLVHRRHVLVEHRQLARDLLRQEVGVGGGHLCHLHEERPELAHHACNQFGLRLEVLGIGLEERLDIAQRTDLAPHDRDIPTHQRSPPQDFAELPLVEAPARLEDVDDLDQQRLIGAQHEAHHVQTQLAEALDLR
jgi:hypothetical protein